MIDYDNLPRNPLTSEAYSYGKTLTDFSIKEYGTAPSKVTSFIFVPDEYKDLKRKVWDGGTWCDSVFFDICMNGWLEELWNLVYHDVTLPEVMEHITDFDKKSKDAVRNIHIRAFLRAKNTTEEAKESIEYFKDVWGNKVLAWSEKRYNEEKERKEKRKKAKLYKTVKFLKTDIETVKGIISAAGLNDEDKERILSAFGG